MTKGDVDQAIRQYRDALSIRQEDLNAHYNLAVALQQKGELREAAAEFKKANELDANRNRSPK